MTVFRFRPAGFLIALCLSLAGVAAYAADEPNIPNTFLTPGYPGALGQTAPSGSSNRGALGGQLDPNAPRSIQNNNNPATQRQGTQNFNQSDEFYRRLDQPPPKPGEFQKFVEGATGRLLPLFGSSFFKDAANPYAPVDNIPVSADYTVGPGDEIVLRMQLRRIRRAHNGRSRPCRSRVKPPSYQAKQILDANCMQHTV